MKRDIDLARQLLLDIENRGIDCSVSVLRTGPNQEAEERIRYHLRLLIDGGLLKEIDRTANNVPCVRLTHDGHELLELSRHEGRWREAKWICQERTGGLSLAVVRTILVRLALAAGRPLSRRRYYPAGRPAADVYSTARPAYRFEPWRHEVREWTDADEAYLPRWRTDRRDAYYAGGYANGYCRNGIDVDGDGVVDFEFEATLPDYLI
ncbi:MAG: DUF2513 domain-containing protein [Pirellulales bacterium]|nr:DUF2513 domain-containing protein [Pirellulales bacterium]